MPHVDLLELPYFEGISMDQLVGLVELLKPSPFEADRLVVKEGDPGPHCLYIATHGRILITKNSPSGEQRQIAELTAPTLFGEIELFCQIPAVCSARAVTKVSTFALDRPTFDRLFAEKNPALLRFTFNVARVACHRLAIADEILTQLLNTEDLVKMRQNVFAQMSEGGNWARMTGAFRKI